MTIAVAEASGLVGRALTAQLLANGHDVLAVGRSATSDSTDARAVTVGAT
jgi:nucleoside-diphosphate-sugar epimerase